jgi:hypothetical protein
MVTTALQQQVLDAALALALADDADAPVTDDVALARLIAFGDVLRAFAGESPFPTPSTIRVWVKDCDANVLARAVAMHTAALAGLPARHVGEGIKRGLLVRDQAWSIHCAMRWRHVLTTLDRTLDRALDGLDDAMIRYDAALRKNGVGPRMIATLLGDRARLS